MPNTFKINGTKLVPLERFNLEPAKPSVVFAQTQSKKIENFTIKEHPIVQSIDLKPEIFVTEILKPHFPIIEQNTNVTPLSVFNDFEDSKITHIFPTIEVVPNGNSLFYYEEVLDSDAKVSGYLGKVTLKYRTINRPKDAAQRYINIDLAEAILNLKINTGKIQINGIVDSKSNEITFELKDEAVKIAFSNLITNIKANKCDIDLYFNFKGYSRSRKNFNIAIINKDLSKITALKNISSQEITKRKLITPMVVRNTSKTSLRKANNTQILKSLAVDANVNTELIKSTFILKANFTINYPLEKKESEGLYKHFTKHITENPFNLNEKFSEFEQIFYPGFKFDTYTVYKSKVQPNLFLIIPKKYYLARDSETTSSCINLIFHAYEDGTGLSEDISKISIQYAISPNISELELNKLKIDLFQFGLLDEKITDYFNKVQFLFPNDIGAEFEVTGNHLIAPSEVSIDGKSFLFNFTTEKLAEASILINSFNNSISQFANITIRHREIRDTANMELNIEKTVGDFLDVQFDKSTGKLLLTNFSYSPCKISNILLISENDSPYFNQTYFENSPNVDSLQTSEIELIKLTNSTPHLNPKGVCLEYESIEDISKEFNQAISTSTDYNRSIVVEFIKITDAKIKRINVDLVVRDTDSSFSFEKESSDFKTPLLFNFITKNQALLNPYIDYKVRYYDKNNNLLTTKSFAFNYSDSSRIYIEK